MATTAQKPKTVTETNDVRTDSDRVNESAGEREVTIDRRRDDHGVEATSSPSKDGKKPVNKPRPKANRRRHIDPTTCERDYSDPEVEFMRAMDDYKRRAGRMFPTCSEVLEVIRDLGYVQLTDQQHEALFGDVDAAQGDVDADDDASFDDANDLEAELEFETAN